MLLAPPWSYEKSSGIELQTGVCWWYGEVVWTSVFRPASSVGGDPASSGYLDTGFDYEVWETVGKVFPSASNSRNPVRRGDVLDMLEVVCFSANIW